MNLSLDERRYLSRLERWATKLSPGPLLPSVRDPIKEENIGARIRMAIVTRRAQLAAPAEMKPVAAAKAFPGMVDPSAKRKTKELTIDTKIPRWHSTGLYAAPGEAITVELARRVVGQGLKLRIGAHTDGLWHKAAWNRAPEITRTFPLDTNLVKGASAFGGLVYIEVPENCPLGNISLRVKGAVEAPLYVHGQTNKKQWLKVRDYPAHWAELQSDKLIVTVPSDAIRQLDRPDLLMDYWDEVLDGCADLATIPRKRKSPERIVFDAQISAGFMHAGYPIMCPLSEVGASLDLPKLQRQGNWGLYHEIGHNHQEQEWTWDGLTEVTVNLFSLYLLDTLNPGAEVHPAVRGQNPASLVQQFQQTGRMNGAFMQLVPYMQLQQDFGWEPFKQVFAEYRQLPDDQRPRSLQERRDQWLVRFSKAVGHNLAPFYDSWKMPTSPAARQQVNDLPTWTPSWPSN